MLPINEGDVNLRPVPDVSLLARQFYVAVRRYAAQNQHACAFEFHPACVPTLTLTLNLATHGQAAETKALALGAVNSNLLELKRRINSTLHDMLTVTASLETARQRLDRKRAEAVRAVALQGPSVMHGVCRVLG